MNLPIHSITIGSDGFVYVCLKVPKIEGTEPRSEHVTIKFSAESIHKLMEMKRKEKEEH